MKRTTSGAKYLKSERAGLQDKEPVCIQHYMRTSELVRVSDNVVKRSKGVK